MKKFFLMLFLFLSFLISFSYIDLSAADKNVFNVIYNKNKGIVKANWENKNDSDKYTFCVNNQKHNVTGLNSFEVPVNKNTFYAFKLIKDDSSGERQVGFSSLYTGEITNIKTSLKAFNKIEIDYSKVNNASGYYIYRKKNNGGFELIHVINKNITNYLDEGLQYNNLYHYKVLPYYLKDGVKFLGFTDKVVSESTYKPSKVTGFKIIQTDIDTNKLSWKKQNNYVKYSIYVSNKKNGKYRLLKNTKKTSLYHKNLSLNKTYYYKVASYRYVNDKRQYGEYSKIVAKTVKISKPKIKVIVGKSRTLRISYTGSKTADYYQVYRSLDGKKYKLIRSTKYTSFVDKNLKKYRTYYYKARAVKKINNKKFYSKFSNVDRETTNERNAKSKLNLKSVYGDNEAYHPDVLAFDTKWNGYKYWLSFTPYPGVKGSSANGNYFKENPHIRASNDMKHWVVPSKESNPLDVPDFKNAKGQVYNSDSDIVYNKDLNRLECFWRRYTKDKITLYMKYTKDGKHWSDKAVIYEVTTSSDIFLSPAIVYEDGVYKMWHINGYVIRYKEFKELPFKKPIVEKNIYINNKKGDAYPWHLDVIKANGKYRMIYCGTPKKGVIRYMSLYYTESHDGKKWDTAKLILSPSKDKNAWDNRGIYRSSILYFEEKYYVFYSASNKKNIKGTGVIYGNDVNDLYPLFND